MSETDTKKYELNNNPDLAWDVFENAIEGILIADANGIILKTNRAFEEIFGYSDDELKGKSMDSVIIHNVIDDSEPPANQTDKNGGREIDLKRERIITVAKSGEKIAVTGRLTFSGTGDSFSTAFILEPLDGNKSGFQYYADKLARLNAELGNKVKQRTLMLEETILELNKAREELKVALEKEKELNDLKSKFVSLVSHEFRTPMASVMSSVDLLELLSKPENNPGIKLYLQRIRGSVQNMVEILDDLLTISHIENGKESVQKDEFEISEFFIESIAEIRRQRKCLQQVHYSHTGDEWAATDRHLLIQIVHNLLGNAIKFSEADTTITVNTRAEAGQLFIEIKDQGIRIPNTEMPHLFERFFRASNADHVPGTGLGLFIVEQYMQLLNGNISFQSEVNQGTTVSVTIPMMK
ncbi:MAG: PAS domain S-box protein [Bacteroidetes bacterium]|nr:PAS domain S-box protein [Bacteroidota bacterium]